MKHYQVVKLAEGLLIVNGQTVGRQVVNCHWASGGNRAEQTWDEMRELQGETNLCLLYCAPSIKVSHYWRRCLSHSSQTYFKQISQCSKGTELTLKGQSVVARTEPLIFKSKDKHTDALWTRSRVDQVEGWESDSVQMSRSELINI